MPTVEENFAAAEQAYLANVPPFLSVSQCQAFIRACAQMSILLPKRSGTQQSDVWHNPELILQQQHRAEEWLQANGGSSALASDARNRVANVVRVDLRNSRY